MPPPSSLTFCLSICSQRFQISSMELTDCPLSLCTIQNSSGLSVEGKDGEIDECFISSNGFPLSQAEDEYIDTLVSKETAFSNTTHSHSISCDDLSLSYNPPRRERFESVRWILKMKSCFGFGFQTAYLAVTYFDRFLLRRNIHEGKPWATELLSIACLSLAAKMEECTAPGLSEYRLEGYRFSSDVIQRMELLVLDTLEWRLNTVTPFDYLSYFANKFHSEHRSRNLLISPAIGFIFVIVEAMNLMDYRPSTIAAAAILAASGVGLTKDLLESKTSVFSLPQPSEIEHIFTCYNAMIHDSQKEKNRFQRF